MVAPVENLLDRTFLVALTPTPNIGEPRISVLVSAGTEQSSKVQPKGARIPSACGQLRGPNIPCVLELGDNDLVASNR